MARLPFTGFRSMVFVWLYYTFWYPVVNGAEDADDMYGVQIDHEAWCEPIFNSALTCLPRNMFMVPRDIPEDVEVFCGSGNRISATANALEGLRLLPFLKVIKLNKNHIGEISPRVFEPMLSLQVLELKGNLLTTIASNDFGIHRTLQTLMLQRNRIFTIETGAFSNLESLQTLLLDGNQVAGIAPRAWPPVSNSALITLSMHSGNPSNCSVLPYTVGEVTCECTELHGSEDNTYCVYGGQIVPTYAKIDRIAAALADVEGTNAFADDVVQYVYQHRQMAITGRQHTRSVFILSQKSTPNTHVSNRTWESDTTPTSTGTPLTGVLCGAMAAIMMYFVRYARRDAGGKILLAPVASRDANHPWSNVGTTIPTRRHRLIGPQEDFQFDV